MFLVNKTFYGLISIMLMGILAFTFWQNSYSYLPNWQETNQFLENDCDANRAMTRSTVPDKKHCLEADFYRKTDGTFVKKKNWTIGFPDSTSGTLSINIVSTLYTEVK